MDIQLSPGAFLLLATVFACFAATGELIAGDRLAKDSRYALPTRLLRLHWYPAYVMWAASAALCGHQALCETAVVMALGLVIVGIKGGRAAFIRPSHLMRRRLIMPTLVAGLSAVCAAARGFPFADPDGFAAFEVLTGLFGACLLRESATFREPEPAPEPKPELRDSAFG